MAKTNFTKMENALSDSLQKIKVQELLNLADNKCKGLDNSELTERKHLMGILKIELKRLYRKDKEIYKKLGTKKKELEKLFANVEQLSNDEWKNILLIKEKVEDHLKNLPYEQSSNDQLVEQSREKHINKRFNVSDRWLPLT